MPDIDAVVSDAVVLAAGLSTRSDGYKMALPLGDRTVIEATIGGMYDLVGRILVVVGYNADVVRALEEGTDSELCAANALQATEIIFACWESARRRGRVELPLDIDDNPLEEMVASGALRPAKR